MANKKAPAAASASLEELNETMRILEEEAIDKDERIANLEETVSNLSLKTQAAAPIKLPVVEVGGKDYQITTHAAFVKNERLTAEEIANSPETLAYLVEVNSSVLKALKNK